MNITDPSQRLREATRLLIQKLGVLERGEAICSGITLTQCHVIVETGRKQQLSVNELAELLNLDKSTVSRMVDQLVNSGSIIREPDPNDRRFVMLKLTATGEELFKNIEQSMGRYFTDTLESIPVEKREQVVESLEIFSEILKNIKCI
jgi:DNA-binding MarR family transcriptional regulator